MLNGNSQLTQMDVILENGGLQLGYRMQSPMPPRNSGNNNKQRRNYLVDNSFNTRNGGSVNVTISPRASFLLGMWGTNSDGRRHQYTMQITSPKFYEEFRSWFSNTLIPTLNQIFVKDENGNITGISPEYNGQPLVSPAVLLPDYTMSQMNAARTIGVIPEIRTSRNNQSYPSVSISLGMLSQAVSSIPFGTLSDTYGYYIDNFDFNQTIVQGTTQMMLSELIVGNGGSRDFSNNGQAMNNNMNGNGNFGGGNNYGNFQQQPRQNNFGGGQSQNNFGGGYNQQPQSGNFGGQSDFGNNSQKPVSDNPFNDAPQVKQTSNPFGGESAASNPFSDNPLVNGSASNDEEINLNEPDDNFNPFESSQDVKTTNTKSKPVTKDTQVSSDAMNLLNAEGDPEEFSKEIKKSADDVFGSID